jgi:hypothetical protein
VGDRVAGVPLQAVAGGLMLRFHCANLVFFLFCTAVTVAPQWLRRIWQCSERLEVEMRMVA